MGEIRMYSEARTDSDYEVTGLPAKRWAEAIFKIGEEGIVFDVRFEKDIIEAIMADENTTWKSTPAGLKQLIKKAVA